MAEFFAQYKRMDLPVVTQPTQTSPVVLGDVLYAKTKAPVPEQNWAMLVHAIAGGDQLALHALFEMAHRIVFTLIMRMTGNRNTAEELTITVFRDISCGASHYDPGKGTVLGWIMNQARSHALERLRFESREKDDVVKRREGTESLRASLAVLTPDERLTIETTFFGGFTQAEAAARLHKPLGTIKTHIRSGLYKLRHTLTAAGKP